MPGVTMVTLEISGQTLWLLPEKAVFLPESDTLIVADAHIGEVPAMQAAGVVVPGSPPDDPLRARTARRAGADDGARPARRARVIRSSRSTSKPSTRR